MKWSGSPAAAIGEPSGATTAIEPRWTDSTWSPRVTSTSAGGGAAPERRLARAGTRDANWGNGVTVGLLPAATLSGRLSFALLRGRLLRVTLALAEDAGAAATLLSGLCGLGATLCRLSRLRRRPRARLTGHRHAALPVGALLDHEHLGLDVALDPTRRADLESTAAIDVALVIAVDDHVMRLDRAADSSLWADDERSLAFDLALRLALDPQVAVTDVLPVEAGMGIDDALVAAIVTAGKFAG